MFDEHDIKALSPALPRRYPLKRSVHYDEDFARAVNDWFLSYDLLPDDAQRHALHATNFPYVTAVCWPACDRTCLFDLACLTVALNVRDHEFDTHHRGHVEQLTRNFLSDISSDCTRCTDQRWGPVFADIWHRLRTHLSPTLLARLGDTIADYLRGCVDYDRNVTTRGQPRSLEEYMTWRERTIGQAIDHRMIEISVDIDLPEHARAHPLVRHLTRIDIRRTILAQDILSVKKELLDGEQENAVAVIATTQHCPLDEALDRARAHYETEMSRFDQAHRELLNSDPGQRADLRRWTTGLNDFHAGLLEWSTGSARYTLSQTSTWSNPDMIIGQPRSGIT